MYPEVLSSYIIIILPNTKPAIVLTFTTFVHCSLNMVNIVSQIAFHSR